MRLRNYNSTATADITTSREYHFYRDEEEHEVEAQCPICDGDGWVYYTEVEEGDDDQRFDCPCCGGSGEITAYFYTEEIDEYESHEESYEVAPYEDNHVSFGGSSDSDHISSRDERGIASLVTRFLNSGEKIEKIQKEKENKERLAFQQEQVNQMISNLFAYMEDREQGQKLAETIASLVK